MNWNWLKDFGLICGGILLGWIVRVIVEYVGEDNNTKAPTDEEKT